MVYYDAEYVSISYSEDARAILCEWKIPLMSDEFRTGMDRLLSAIGYFKTGKIVADTRFQGILHPNDQDWIAAEWMEKALEIGYSHIALVMTDDIYSRMVVEHLVEQQAGTSVIVAYFDDLAKALTWIKNE